MSTILEKEMVTSIEYSAITRKWKKKDLESKIFGISKMADITPIGIMKLSSTVVKFLEKLN